MLKQNHGDDKITAGSLNHIKCRNSRIIKVPRNT